MLRFLNKIEVVQNQVQNSPLYSHIIVLEIQTIPIFRFLDYFLNKSN